MSHSARVEVPELWCVQLQGPLCLSVCPGARTGQEAEVFDVKRAAPAGFLEELSLGPWQSLATLSQAAMSLLC